MPWLDPRYKLVVCAALDLAVLVGLALSVAATKAQPLWFQLNWLVLWALLYLGLGWLFGSYTVLRWHRLARMTLLRRVLLTSVVSAVALALMRQISIPLMRLVAASKHSGRHFFWIDIVVSADEVGAASWDFDSVCSTLRACWR